jgi:uncharacterized OsmC-like protein
MTPEETAKIKNAMERARHAMEARESVGRGTAITRVRLDGPLHCTIEDGPWKLTASMAEKHGGTGVGPDPGVFGRGALGSCLAVGYAMWAARLGVELQSLEVEVQADYDARGEYGVGTVRPGYREIRFVVTVTSQASEEEVMRVLDQADAHSPYLDIFTNPQQVRRIVRLNAVETAPAVGATKADPK